MNTRIDLFKRMNSTGPTTFGDDALPPEGTYESRESLLSAINSWAKPRGYAFTTGKSTKTPNGRVKIVFACDRNKLPPSTFIERKRRTCSRRAGCKFSVLAKQSLDGSTWVLSHRPDKDCAQHNHPPTHRQLNERDAAIISNLTTAGTAPRDIRTYLHNNSDTLATQQDAKAVYKRSLTSYMKRVSGVRFDWIQTIGLLPSFRPSRLYVLLLDCTYKTNKHAMPLLDMRSFCIAFAFLSGESEADYSWTLHHLKSLYQHELPSVVLTDRCLAAINAAATWFPTSKALLCLWHVNKAVLQYCQPDFVQRVANRAVKQKMHGTNSTDFGTRLWIRQPKRYMKSGENHKSMGRQALAFWQCGHLEVVRQGLCSALAALRWRPGS
ncbi:MULE transposase [Hirsutella rhossiliensis]